jgi:hypothetical protein
VRRDDNAFQGLMYRFSGQSGQLFWFVGEVHVIARIGCLRQTLEFGSQNAKGVAVCLIVSEELFLIAVLA